MALAPYAMKDEKTWGRRFAEPAHSYRSEYQRDRDRIIHTKAFRRLEKKTQVFAPDYSDHFRNRLTHTLEVSQISRTISEALGLNTDLCEVLALSHDIGHPPYSHEGEKVLDLLMKEYGEGFEHNLHALRILEDFEEKYLAFRGLNLTFEVREGIIKHSRDYEENARPYIDISEYRLGERPPLEAQLIDVADEIAYNTADLDDGFSAGLLDVEQLNASLAIFRQLWNQVASEFPDADEKLRVNEVLRRIIDLLVSNLIQSTARRLEARDVDSVEKVRRSPERLVGFDREVAGMNADLKQFLRRNLYDHKVLKAARSRAREQLNDLFHYYYRAAENLPEGHRGRLRDLPRHRVICDYIAGMTDSFAALQHMQVFGMRGASPLG